MENKKYWLFCALSPTQIILFVIIYTLFIGEYDSKILYLIISFLINFIYIKYFKLRSTALLIPLMVLISLILSDYYFGKFMGEHLLIFYIIINVILIIFSENRIKYLLWFHTYIYFATLYFIVGAYIFIYLVHLGR